MTDSEPQIVRLVGGLEKCSTARHSLGFYSCVAVTGEYKINRSIQDLSSTIEGALAKVVLKHPALCCGIINEDKKDPAFIRLNSINISERIQYSVFDDDAEGGRALRLPKVLEDEHHQLFPDISKKPAWRLHLVQQKSQNPSETCFDAVFAYHHALADGLSGVVFHRSLLAALNSLSVENVLENHILRVPKIITLAPPVEKAIDFKISWPFLLWTIWRELRPKWLFPDNSPPWAGEICSSATIKKFKHRIKLINLDAATVAKVVATCRKHETTVTGLLHSLVVASLSSHVPEAKSFNSSTPFSLRKLSGLSPTDEMGVQVSAITSKYSLDTLTAIRVSSDPARLTEQIWKVAQDYRAEMKTELAKMPNDTLTAMLKYVGDYHNMYASKIGMSHGHTYEISNVGRMKNEEGGEWKVERLVFSQPGTGVGAALGISVSSVVDRPLSICFSWLEGDIEEDLVNKLIADMDHGLRCVAAGRDISIGF